MSKAEVKWLSREDIDAIIADMSAADLLEASGGDLSGPQVAGVAFDAAAKRLGKTNGTSATSHVRPADLRHLVKAVGEAASEDSPLSSGQES